MKTSSNTITPFLVVYDPKKKEYAIKYASTCDTYEEYIDTYRNFISKSDKGMKYLIVGEGYMEKKTAIVFEDVSGNNYYRLYEIGKDGKILFSEKIIED